MFGAISAITGGIGSVANYFGQREANNTNRQNMRDANAVTEAESARNREFQREMSNTSHQREVADLKAAGLNPLLSATGGASTPGGSAGSGQTGSGMENELQGAVTSAKEAIEMGLAVKKQKQEIKNLKSQEKLTSAQTKKTHIESTLKNKDTPLAEMQNEILRGAQQIWGKVKGSIQGTARQMRHQFKSSPKTQMSKQPVIRLPGRN